MAGVLLEEHVPGLTVTTSGTHVPNWRYAHAWNRASCDERRASGSRHRFPARVDRTHQADRVSVWVTHDAIASAHEAVMRRLLREVARTGEVVVGCVDGRGRSQP